MLKIKDQYVLNGSRIEVSWNLDTNLRFLFLWHPISWLPWKNYKSIDSFGETSLHVDKKYIEIKIKQLHFGDLNHYILLKETSIQLKLKILKANYH